MQIWTVPVIFLYFLSTNVLHVWAQCNNPLRIPLGAGLSEVISPGWLDGYEQNLNCTWIFVTDDIQSSVLFKVTNDVHCGDRLAVYNGEDIMEDNICREGRPVEAYTSPGKPLIVRFQSDDLSYPEEQGFIVQALTAKDEHCGSGRPLYVTEDEQSFTSKYFPKDYPANVTCEFTLIPMDKTKRIQIKFPYAKNELVEIIEEGMVQEICIDNIDIFQGSSKIGHACGTGFPEFPITFTGSDGATLKVIFTSDGKNQYRGFKATHILVPGVSRQDTIPITTERSFFDTKEMGSLITPTTIQSLKSSLVTPTTTTQSRTMDQVTIGSTSTLINSARFLSREQAGDSPNEMKQIQESGSGTQLEIRTAASPSDFDAMNSTDSLNQTQKMTQIEEQIITLDSKNDTNHKLIPDLEAFDNSMTAGFRNIVRTTTRDASETSLTSTSAGEGFMMIHGTINTTDSTNTVTSFATNGSDTREMNLDSQSGKLSNERVRTTDANDSMLLTALERKRDHPQSNSAQEKVTTTQITTTDADKMVDGNQGSENVTREVTISAREESNKRLNDSALDELMLQMTSSSDIVETANSSDGLSKSHETKQWISLSRQNVTDQGDARSHSILLVGETIMSNNEIINTTGSEQVALNGSEITLNLQAETTNTSANSGSNSVENLNVNRSAETESLDSITQSSTINNVKSGDWIDFNATDSPMPLQITTVSDLTIGNSLSDVKGPLINVNHSSMTMKNETTINKLDNMHVDTMIMSRTSPIAGHPTAANQQVEQQILASDHRQTMSPKDTSDQQESTNQQPLGHSQTNQQVSVDQLADQNKLDKQQQSDQNIPVTTQIEISSAVSQRVDQQDSSPISVKQQEEQQSPANLLTRQNQRSDQEALQVSSPHCRPGWIYYNNRCYLMSLQRSSWFEAQYICRTMEGTLAAVQNKEEDIFLQELSKNYAYVGCFKDFLKTRVLPVFFHKPNLTNRWCIEKCRSENYAFAGTQFHTQCFCGNVSWDRLESSPEEDCYTQCAGHQEESCGGHWRLSVFDTRGRVHWLGGSDFENEGTWRWQPSTELLTYTNWLPGEPNNQIHPDMTLEHCLSLFQDKRDGHFRWNDDSCDTLLHFICERRAENSQ